MGNYRFKLSELVPNAWLYKLRDMGKSRKKQQNSSVSLSPIKKHQPVVPTPTTARSPRLPPRRSSSYYARPGSHTPRKFVRNRATTTPSSAPPKKVISPESLSPPEFRSDQLLIPDESLESSSHSPCSCVTSKAEATFTPPPDLHLHPIITKPTTTVRKTAASSSPAGVRLRLRSPRVSTRKTASSGARTTGTSATASSRRSRAVVKASVDPRRDFKESMEEMIAENNIRASKDLEELLACYLCLNSDEYHHIIINVFKQIWLDLNL